MPFKARALELADETAPAAMKCGAVNTLVWDGFRVSGMNTDGSAVSRILKSGLGDLKGRRILVLGAGGAGAAAAAALAEAKAEIVVANRSRTRAVELAGRISTEARRLDEIDMAHFDAVVQATSAGMAPRTDEEPLDGNLLREGTVVIEMVYEPRETLFSAKARRAGAVVFDGRTMFAYQAAEQFHAWTGIEVDPGEILGILEREDPS
jgi:shikimate dehydrogenase